MNVDFIKLRTEIKKPESKTTIAKDSIIYSEFSFSLANIIETAGSLTTDELAMLTLSIQSWINRKEFTTCKVPVNIGDIFLADLGNCYKPELACPHPVVILEKVGSLVFIIPSSTSPKTVAKAYHPIDNTKGDTLYRKVNTKDGFNCDCALILSNTRTISQGRLLSHLGQLNNINDPNSLFVEIKNKCFEFNFPKHNIQLVKALQQIDELKRKNSELEVEKEQLKLHLDGLKSS